MNYNNSYNQQGLPQQQCYQNGYSNQTSQPFGNTMAQPGFLPPQPGFPQAQPGFPQAQLGFPQAQPGFPQAQPGLSQAQPGFPQAQPGYSPAQSSYHQAAQPGFPQQNQYQSYPSHVNTNQAYSVTSNLTPVKPKSKPTVVPVSPFDPQADVAVLRKAMKGFGTDEKAIIQILTRRSNEQRQRIANEFRTVHRKDLVLEMKRETSGKFEDLLVALMTPLPQYYAKELHDAIAGIGTDEDVLIEVMCTMSNHEINVIKQAYTARYSKSLEDDIRGDTSGYFKKLMILLAKGGRSEDSCVDQAKAKEDAKSLYKAGEGRLGTDESVFNTIFSSRSLTQLAATFQEYQLIKGRDIDDAIKSEFSGDIEKALRAIVKLVRNKPLFFAERLHKSMKGLGTNDRQLIRVMVTRCELDLGDISDMFQKKFGGTLKSWIEGDCSGDYKKALIALLG